MNLNRENGESPFQHHKRLILEKTEGKELSDVDYAELSDFIYGQHMTSDHTRKMIRGSKYTLDMMDSDVGDTENQPVRSETTIDANGNQSHTTLVTMNENQSKDPDFLLQAHGYDPSKFELISARNSIWSSGASSNQMYSSKITVKPRAEAHFDEIKAMFENMNREHKPMIPHPNSRDKNVAGQMLEVNIADLHLGKLAWAGETGYNYDWHIATDRFLTILDDFIERARGRMIDKIVFVYSNDFFHFDTIQQTTTSGTPQDSDLRWQKMFQVGVGLLIESIEKLSEIAPVETFYIDSNHDRMISFYACNYLEAWFRNDDNVTVNASPSPRKYIRYGQNLIGFSHGNNEKNRIFSLMQIEERENWGATKYHEFHCGHYHSEKTKEENGVIVRYVGSPTGTDAWHNSVGYIGAVQKGTAFLWDKENGLTDIWYSNV